MAEFDEKLNALLSNSDAMAQIMQMAQSLQGGSGAPSPPPPPVQPQQQPTPSPPPSQAVPPLSGGAGALLEGLDSQLLAQLLPVIRELGSGQNSEARQLLFALRPYLKPERQDKVERALQLARLFRVGRHALLEWRERNV